MTRWVEPRSAVPLGAGGSRGMPPRSAEPGRVVRAVGWLMAAWCIGFAVANVSLETGNQFELGRYAEYAAGLAFMSWVVFALKLVGAAVALASIRARPPVRPALICVLLWGATALLSLYSVGSVVEALGMLTGLVGSRDQITLAGVLYVLFFLLGALGYGCLTLSFTRRFGASYRIVLLGLLGAPAALAVLLVVLPRLLVALGVMPDY